MNPHDKSGGPAHPTYTRIEDYGNGNKGFAHDTGMTVRQYYKAHAPAEPWPEFVPVMPEKPLNHVAIYADMNHLEPGPGPEWRDEERRQRRLQWPGFWADAMLAEDEEHAKRK